MITIEQLLESVDLDFEPRWVTKDEDGTVIIFDRHPEQCSDCWRTPDDYDMPQFDRLKLSEFDGKDWTECIYEVPRKTTGKIEKINKEKFSFVYSRKEKNDIESALIQILDKQAELVDAVNELKGAKNE